MTPAASPHKDATENSLTQNHDKDNHNHNNRT